MFPSLQSKASQHSGFERRFSCCSTQGNLWKFLRGVVIGFAKAMFSFLKWRKVTTEESISQRVFQETSKTRTLIQTETVQS